MHENLVAAKTLIPNTHPKTVKLYSIHRYGQKYVTKTPGSCPWNLDCEMLLVLFGTLPKQLNNEKKPLLLLRQPSSCPDLALGRVSVLCSIPSQNVHCPIGFCIWTLELITNNNIHLLTQPPIILPLVPNIISHTLLKKCLVSASQLKQLSPNPFLRNSWEKCTPPKIPRAQNCWLSTNWNDLKT